MNILVAVPPKILGSSTKQNLHREGNVENAGRREEKKRKDDSMEKEEDGEENDEEA